MVPIIENHPIIGRQLFDVITSGMYDNPLMIFREYIQNSVDSIDLSVEQGLASLDDCKITVQLNGNKRSIIIEDNGLGLSCVQANTILRSLGCSPKEGTGQRGFRGIGRLGGLAYCDELVFETRCQADEEVAVVTWDRKVFEKIASDTSRFVGLLETIENVSNFKCRTANEFDPANFFRVTLNNVQRFHSDVLMSVKMVYEYLAHVAPVAYDHEKLLFAPLIEENFEKSTDYRCYFISVNGRDVRRPYVDSFQISTNVFDSINDIEFFTFAGADDCLIASGWYAKTSFVASLPANLNIRGIRVRQGNIEVGGEHFLENMFTERRFASWQIGEIHILNNSLKPNARRDGFEQSANYERFLEQTSLLGRHLSSLCRKSSNERIAKVRVESTVSKLEQFFSSPVTYLDKEHFESTLEQTKKSLSQIEKDANNGVSTDLKVRYNALKLAVEDGNHKPLYIENILDGRRLRKFDQKSLLAHIAKVVVSSYDKNESAESLLQKILLPFTRPGHAEQIIIQYSK